MATFKAVKTGGSARFEFYWVELKSLDKIWASKIGSEPGPKRVFYPYNYKDYICPKILP
jgi:hypothetical protein